MQMKKWLSIGAVAALLFAGQAHAAPKFFYRAGQITYIAVPGEHLQVPIYIFASATEGGVSAIQSADGLFSGGVRFSLASPVTGGTIQSVTADPSWDGSQLPTIIGDSAQLYADHASGTGPGALPDGDGKIKLGTFEIVVGTSPDNLIHFDLQDHSAGSSEVVGYDGTEFDGDIAAGQFTIQVPEPASCGVILAGLVVLTRRRRGM